LLDGAIDQRGIEIDDWRELLQVFSGSWVCHDEWLRENGQPELEDGKVIAGHMPANIKAANSNVPFEHGMVEFFFYQDGTAKVFFSSLEDNPLAEKEPYEDDWIGVYEFLLEWHQKHLQIPDLPASA